ncbi:MAG: sensor histidine kinase [Ardenticatenia bacterium]|nr:MAG: sensor histidine kinase [Ardenticatenia bacterium]
MSEQTPLLRTSRFDYIPLRVRLTLWYVGLLGLILMVFGFLLYVLLAQQVRQRDDALVRDVVLQIESALIEEYEVRQRHPPASISMPALDTFLPASTPMFVQVLSPDGVVRMRNSLLGDSVLPRYREDLERAAAMREMVVRTLLLDESAGGSYLRYVNLYTYPVYVGNTLIGYIQVAYPLAETERMLRQLAVAIFGTVVAVCLVALIGGSFLARRALRPVERVTQTALQITRAEDLTRRIPKPAADDEIRHLVEAFNEMLARLEEVFRDQQRFVADVSHELRTPLTTLQSTVDLLRRGAFETPEQQAEALTMIASEVARLKRLVDDLMLLVRADAGETLQYEPVELDMLLLDVYRQAKVLARASGKPLEVRLGHEDQAIVLGDRDRLRQLILNLVDNAIKYTPEGRITLSLYREDGWVRLEVEDTGIGIPKEAQPHLFRRFYRVDRARSRELGGTGLGLAIVQWIAEAHGGYVDVESEEGKGSRFIVYLPIWQPSPRDHSGGAEAATTHPASESHRNPPGRDVVNGQ